MAGAVTASPVGRMAGDEGAGFVEFVLVVPLLVTLLLGVFEFGMAWRARTDLHSALRVALRIDASAGSNSLADWNTVLAMQANLSRVRNVEVDYLIVFKGTATPGATTTVPAACLSLAEGLAVTATAPAGVTGMCNIYTRRMIATTVSSPAGSPAYACTANGSPSTAWDGRWCPRGRLSAMEANSFNGPDAIGIYAKYHYTTYSRLAGSNVVMTDMAVGRIEPR